VRFILVCPRTVLFPGLSPQGFLPRGALDLDALAARCFFAEREVMERCSHFKQIIPYLVLTRGDRVLAYQRRGDHTEKRLGGLWSLGFGGHIEPLDRAEAGVATLGLVRAAALRELTEETGLAVPPVSLVAAGFINSDREDVSSVHLGVVSRVDLGALPDDDDALAATVTAQAEPHQVRWLPIEKLSTQIGPGSAPDGGTFEDWSRSVVDGLFAGFSNAGNPGKASPSC
jgi:predicted NUDIX family phosphoesterase